MKNFNRSKWLGRLGAPVIIWLLAVPGAVAADKAAPTPAGAEELRRAYAATRQETLKKIDAELDAARQQWQKKSFAAADVAYKAVVARIKAQPGDFPKKLAGEIDAEYDSFKLAWATAIMTDARLQARAGKYQAAIDLANTALQQHKLSNDFVSAFIKSCQEKRDGAKFREESKLATAAPDNQQRVVDVDMLLRESKIFYKNKRYDVACTTLERVLLLDPFNAEAMELLGYAYNKLYEIAIRRAKADMVGMDAANVWEWAEPVASFQDRSTDSAATVKSSKGNELYNRLERIVFPNIDFEKTDLMTVIRFLSQQSQRYDPDKLGVNVVFAAPPQYARAPVTIKLSNISMIDVIRYLSKQVDLSFSMGANAVMIGRLGDMRSESFPIRGDIINSIIGEQQTGAVLPSLEAVTRGAGSKGASSGMSGAAIGGPTGGEGGKGAPQAVSSGLMQGFGESASGAANAAAEGARSEKLRKYFEDLGIAFDNGARITYDPVNECLDVFNTMENLREMSNLIGQLNSGEVFLVLIEAKLIELSETNLDELGFEWAFSAAPSAGDWSMSGGGGSSKTINPLRVGNGTDSFRVLNDLKIFPNFGEKIFGSDVTVNLDLSINAVSQNRRAEVLSSPRILTNDGSPAAIVMTEQTYFAEEWEAPETSGEGFNMTITGPQPDWGEAQNLGITFSVTPSIGADGRTITLKDLKPIFTVHSGDTQNPLTYESGFIRADGTRQIIQKQTFNLTMPDISSRAMRATITINDGSTVLLGGMTNNTTKARDDRWPFIGDLPLIGRFFRDQQIDVANSTMLLFITARIIKPDGKPLRSIRDQGVVDFNR